MNGRACTRVSDKSESIHPLGPASAARGARAEWISAIRAALLAGGTQAIVQLVTLLTGLAVVRLLPIHEYAYYTIVNAMLGTLVVLTDGGASQSVLSQGGRVWQDRAALGGIVAGGLKLRRRFAAIAALVSIPIAWFLLRKQGASISAAALLILCTIPIFLSSLTSQLLEVVPRLHQRLWPLQRIQVLGGCLRFVSVVAAAALVPLASVANLASGLAQLWATMRIRSLALTLADWRRPPDPEAWRQMIAYVRRALPGAIYFAFAGQISVWLIALFGSAESVAQVGALTRLAMAFNLVSSVFALVITPRFARLSDRGGSVLTRYWQVQAGFVVLLGLIVWIVSLFPELALHVLGPEYMGLTDEVVLMAAGSALGVLAGTAYGMAAARGVIVSPFASILFSLLVQVVLIVTLPLNTVAGVLWLGALGNALLWVMHATNFSFTIGLAK
jgi:O-antigen/teichoic acid export membrane protein